MPAAPAPHPNRTAAIRRRLVSYYGVPTPKPHGDPVGELVLTVLSQNTNDRNRDVAFCRIVERWPDWDAVRTAPVSELEEAIAPGGISKVKSARIAQILERVACDPLPEGADPEGRWRRSREIDLGWIETAPLEVSRDYLCSLPGVARKTAACVLLFSYGLPDIPVDTHVGRVGKRLGLFREQAGFDEMHDAISAWTPPGLAHAEHVNMLRHGRRICQKRAPKCAICPLVDICPSAEIFLATSS